MNASLDTNVIIHLYQANMQSILFDVFSDDIYLYEQIRNVELEHHGQSVLKLVDADIEKQKIKLYTNDMLRAQGVYKIFENNVKENRFLYGTGDLGEVYAISLAQTIGVFSLVTDDTKQGGPYMSLMQLNYDVMPFNFVDILILRYLLGIADAYQTMMDFDEINEASEMNWAFRSKLAQFIRRFIRDPHKTEEKEWFKNWAAKNSVNALTKLKALRDALR